MSYLKIGKYYGEDESKDVYQIKEVLDSGYEDISDIKIWFHSENIINTDYLFSRSGAINYMNNNGGFSALTEDDKFIMARNFCVDKSKRDTILTDEEQQQYWDLFVKAAENARDIRWHNAKAWVSYRLDLSDSVDLGESTDDLSTKYIRYGIEKKSIDNKDGIYDWINGVGSFNGVNGFPGKDYYTDELRDGILERLDGIKISSALNLPNGKTIKLGIL
jgi:hypothetical protein